MAKHRHHVEDDRQLPAAVAENLGGAYWSVEGAGWPTVRPGLPPHLADLLAPPIVVRAARRRAVAAVRPTWWTASRGADQPAGVRR